MPTLREVFVREQLQAIYDDRGVLTKAIVVEELADPTHPLHGELTWNDEEASHAWRLHQAHQLIQSVRITYRRGDGSTGDVRAFHAIRSDVGYQYEPADAVVGNEFWRRLVLADMERDWKALKRRYDNFDEFWRMVRRDAA